MKILITGATGFIGSELLRYLIFDSSIVKIYLPIRPKYGISSSARFLQLIEFWKKYFPSHVIKSIESNLDKVEIIESDLNNPNLLYNIKECDYIFHAAALTDLDAPLKILRQENLVNTQKLLFFAKKLSSFKKFIYFSTAFVCGTLKGTITEAQKPQSFNNFYEQTKKEAEYAIENFNIPYLILRPSIVIGNTDIGYTKHFKVIYAVFRIWQNHFLSHYVPIDPKAIIDLIPIDYLIKASVYFAFNPLHLNKCIHICSGSKAVTALEIFKSAQEIFNIKNIDILPKIILKLFLNPLSWYFLPSNIKTLINNMKIYFPYLYENKRWFNIEYLKKYFISPPDYNQYAKKIWKFCLYTNWGKNPYPNK